MRQNGDIRGNQRIKEPLHLLRSDYLRMAFSVEKDVQAGPVDVGLGCPGTVLATATAPNNLIEKAGRRAALADMEHLAWGWEVWKCHRHSDGDDLQNPVIWTESVYRGP